MGKSRNPPPSLHVLFERLYRCCKANQHSAVLMLAFCNGGAQAVAFWCEKRLALNVDGDNRHALELLEAQSLRVAEAQFQRDMQERQEQAAIHRQRCLKAHLERCRYQPAPAVVIRRPKPTLEERMARAYNRLRREKVTT